LRRRARVRYRWDDVADGYEVLARRLANGWSRRGEASGKRRHDPAWAVGPGPLTSTATGSR
jgi:hypothetical protein